MKGKISILQELARKYAASKGSLDNLDRLQPELEAEAKKLIAELSGLPVDALVLPQSGDAHFDAATTQKLRSLNDVRTKLELLPGVRARQQTQAEDLRQKMRIAVRGLVRTCRDLATSQMEDLQSKLASELLVHCGGDADRSKAAATSVVEKSGAERWVEAFRYYNHLDGPAEDAREAIALAEAFARGEPAE